MTKGTAVARTAKPTPKAVPDPKPAHTGAYTVTSFAGPRVAGRSVKPGDLLQLAPNEAAHELRIGTIELENEAPSKAV